MAKFQQFLSRIGSNRDRAALRGIFSQFLTDDDPPALKDLVLASIVLSGAETTQITISGANTTGILLSGASSADGISITGVCADGIHVSSACTASAIHISGDQVIGILYDVTAAATHGMKIAIPTGITLTAGVDINATSTGAVTSGLTMQGTGTFTAGITLSATAMTTGITISAGSMTDAIKISGTTPVDGVEVSSVCSAAAFHVSSASAVGLLIAGACSTTGINISGNCGTGLTIGAQTAAGISIGATAIGINCVGAITNLFDLPASGTAPVSAGGTVGTHGTATLKIAIDIGGVTYYLLASTVPTFT